MSGFEGSLIDENSLNSRQIKNGMFNFIKTNTIKKKCSTRIIISS